MKAQPQSNDEDYSTNIKFMHKGVACTGNEFQHNFLCKVHKIKVQQAIESKSLYFWALVPCYPQTNCILNMVLCCHRSNY